MYNIDLIKKLNEFYIYANVGLYRDKILNMQNYVIAYCEKVPDIYSNYASIINIKDKVEFNSMHSEIKKQMDKLNRQVCYMVSPANETLYNNRKDFFTPNLFKEIDNEVWQIFNDFDILENMRKFTNFNVKLEKTNDMEKFAIITDEFFNTGDKDDPYFSLDKGYIDMYKNCVEDKKSKYTREFYFIKVNNEIVGVTVSVYGDGICGIHGLAIKKEYRKHGIGKEVLKKQLNICKNKNVDFAFLQTEAGFYPAQTYRKFGFKDICNVYYYIEK